MRSLRSAVLLLLLAAVRAVPAAGQVDVPRGIENLIGLYAAAQVLDFHRAMGTVPETDEQIVDPWGTPYRLDLATATVAGAGRDRKFDESTWGLSDQFANLEDDVVMREGRVLRTNRHWLWDLGETGDHAAEYESLRSAEVVFMVMTTPEMRQLTALRLSAMAVQQLAELVERQKEADGGLAELAGAEDPVGLLISRFGGSPRLRRDAWGTPLRVSFDGSGYRIASAGADRIFQPERWNEDAELDPAEDLVLENGVLRRHVDEMALRRRTAMKIRPLEQPVDRVPPEHLDPEKWARVGDGIVPAVVTDRTPFAYPGEYKELRLLGTVVLECEISAWGQLGLVRVASSVAPDFDMAAIEVVRRWKFSPATRGGRPVASLLRLNVDYRLTLDR